jgi:signal peptidase II
MLRWRRIALVLATLLTLVGCDQKTKTLAREHLRAAGSKSFLDDTLRLEYAENPGAFLSLGADLPAKARTLLFTIGCSAGIAAILLYTLLASQPGPWQVLAMSLICGGGLGNLADRWMYGGYVRDFLDIGFGRIRTGVFNVADVALLTGCLILLFARSRTGLHPNQLR